MNQHELINRWSLLFELELTSTVSLVDGERTDLQNRFLKNIYGRFSCIRVRILSHEFVE